MQGSGNVGSFLSSIYSLMYFLPSSYLYLTTVMISAVAVFMLFKGKKAWDFTFMALGAYYGFVFALYVTSLVNASDIPIYLIFIIGGVVGAVIMVRLVQVALPAGIAVVAFLVAQQVYPSSLIIDIAVGAVVFGIASLLYNNIKMLLAGMAGAFLMWLNLSVMGVNTDISQVLAGLLFALGLYLQITENKRRKEEMRRMTAARFSRLSRVMLVKREAPMRTFGDDESFSDFY
ncbi:MAG: hypothetical protein M1151_05510 [Candidatus Thermoplasmatota archaeon]|nr:hypothetical protein [Candidatus Thermoplasmatota archaeon]MCL5786104.1 hypothetical protein [Candidatus Thermoplasmatota archaeon]